jgi:hypothetical protein
VEAAFRAAHAGLEASTDGDAFARRLTALMQSVVPDRHLHVEYSAVALAGEAAPTAGELAQFHALEEQSNYGVERVERLPGNIGYVDLRSFSRMSSTYPGATAIAPSSSGRRTACRACASGARSRSGYSRRRPPSVPASSSPTT